MNPMKARGNEGYGSGELGFIKVDDSQMVILFRLVHVSRDMKHTTKQIQMEVATIYLISLELM